MRHSSKSINGIAGTNASFRSMPASTRARSSSSAAPLVPARSDLIARDADKLAAIGVTDNGKLLAEMAGQLRYIPEWLYYYGGLADKIEGGVIPTDKQQTFNYTKREPLGVVVAIAPWNSPLLLLTWKLAPALAAGNTIVMSQKKTLRTSTRAYWSQNSYCSENSSRGVLPARESVGMDLLKRAMFGRANTERLRARRIPVGRLLNHQICG
jgi:aldehyde dehydrogenase (NAD+)